ncbi:MAG TPA: amidohydrolase [Streptosporangiaceae bacterium]|nr:amidohydrolase [Streptosporangiaceae bacterium]
MELIVEDAEFVTMAADAGPAEALLVRDGRIAAVGPAEAVRAAASPGARVARLDGAAVVPGLIDAHCHVCDVGYLAAAADCSQPSAPDIPAIQARLREAADRTPEGSWVTGGGYVEYKLREGRHPTRADLDQAVPNRPAVVYHTSLHACVLNTAALREAGFADGQSDPPGGAFGRDREGRLDGVVFEGPMFALFERNLRHDLARMGAAQSAAMVEMAGQRLAALGLTAACEADMRRDSFGAFAEADANGLLSQRIYGLVVHDQVDWLLGAGPAQGAQGIPRGRRSGRLAAEAVKIWADGGMSSRSAAIHGSYPVPPYGSGILFFERDELTGMVRDFDARGFQVAIHAQGDRAIETVLDAYGAVLAGTAGNPRRHRIEHAGAMYPPLAARAAALGIVVASQPGFLSTLGDGFAAAFGDRGDELYAFGSWRRAGITVAGSSDAPVITADPLVGIRDAVLRRTGDGLVLGPAERLPARDALDLYTTQAAFAMHREGEIGSLEPGKLADFVVLDRSPLRGDPERVTDIRVLATVLGGTPVYQSETVFAGLA